MTRSLPRGEGCITTFAQVMRLLLPLDQDIVLEPGAGVNQCDKVCAGDRAPAGLG
ncbi:hypothetical protein ACFXDH_50280 [Streptomyces sp. NPDC059467]|uniref:hypothetical protein n=1 Tax=Streptomyces sp. NPDC059467 TaxID=3346844 RepID=UPI0036BB93A9